MGNIQRNKKGLAEAGKKGQTQTETDGPVIGPQKE
jgi:hypothetical protein